MVLHGVTVYLLPQVFLIAFENMSYVRHPFHRPCTFVIISQSVNATQRQGMLPMTLKNAAYATFKVYSIKLRTSDSWQCHPIHIYVPFRSEEVMYEHVHTHMTSADLNDGPKWFYDIQSRICPSRTPIALHVTKEWNLLSFILINNTPTDPYSKEQIQLPTSSLHWVHVPQTWWSGLADQSQAPVA